MNKSIWQEDDEYGSKPITNKDVKKAEEELKVKLPESYISLLKEQNGGYVSYDLFSFQQISKHRGRMIILM